MKRYTLLAATIAVAFSLMAAPAFSAMYVTPKVDLGYGVGDWHDDMDINPMIGGGAILGFSLIPMLSIEGSIAFQYWFADNSDDPTVFHVPFFLGARVGLGMFGIVGGLGGVYRSYDWGPKVDETVFGFYIGGDVNVGPVMIRVQYVYADEGDEYPEDSMAIEVAVGYKISL